MTYSKKNIIPIQTGNNGEFLTTDGTDTSWTPIAGGGDLLSTNNLSDVASAATSRTNLGVDTTANQGDSLNKRFVTDAQLTVISNTSNTNTGDNSVNTLYSGLAASKQDVLVSATNIKTINGASILGSGDLTVSGSDATKLAILNNLSDLNNASTARTNLGINTTANQTDSSDKRFMTDAQETKLDAVVLPTGTPNGSKYLRDDNSWQTISGGSGLAQYQVRQLIRR
jgi:hypothetical protein